MIGIVHPGSMGAAVGGVLVARGIEVGWASAGRSDATRARAEQFTDLRTVDRLRDACEVVMSVCPPHAAVEVAAAFAGYRGLFLDANAVSPATAARVGETVGGRFVDGRSEEHTSELQSRRDLVCRLLLEKKKKKKKKDKYHDI